MLGWAASSPFKVSETESIGVLMNFFSADMIVGVYAQGSRGEKGGI